MKLADLIGQERAVRQLRVAMQTGRIANAYLFIGPAGVGKATAAVAFASAVNCLTDGDDTCGTCASCRKIVSGNHPDVRIISKEAQASAEGKRVRDLSIKQVRPILSEMAYRPYEGKRRFVVFDGAGDLNEPAQNALLKSLEEPPPDTTFVLVTDAPGRLLPTVISRSRIVRFGRVPTEVAAPFLAERLEMTRADATVLASAVGGSLGRALGPEAPLYQRQSREETLDEFLTAATAGGARMLETAENWSKRGEDLPVLLDIAASFLRDATVCATMETDPDALINADLAGLVRAIARGDGGRYDLAFNAVRDAQIELRGAAQDTKLVLEHMLTEAGRALRV